jgi:hypothetical protein
MESETILCIAPRVWNSLWRSTQQIISRIGTQNRVLYFEPGRNPDRHVLGEFIRNLQDFFWLRARTVNNNLILIPSPSQLPVARRYLPLAALRITMPLFAKINSWILIAHIRRAMKALGVTKPILWLYGPGQADLIGRFGEKLSCYYNYDEISNFIVNRRIKDLLWRQEAKLVSRVDIIFASSHAQYDCRKSINPNTYFIPNAVDFSLFNRALEPNTPLPKDIAVIPRPIIGFAGWLGYHINIKLLLRVAEAFANCSVVLIGPDELPDTESRRELRNLSNVFFLGPKERTQLPNYLQVFDVALMPYALSGHIRSAYPLKLHEYLAAGRPIVSTALPEVEPFKHVARIAETDDQFINYIKEALSDNSRESIDARVAVARENTWDRRIEEIYRILKSYLCPIGSA